MKKRFYKTTVDQCMADPINTTELEAVLAMVNVVLPLEVLERWSIRQRAMAEDWAFRLHLSASDNTTVRVPSKPPHVTYAERKSRRGVAAHEGFMSETL